MKLMETKQLRIVLRKTMMMTASTAVLPLPKKNLSHSSTNRCVPGRPWGKGKTVRQSPGGAAARRWPHRHLFHPLVEHPVGEVLVLGRQLHRDGGVGEVELLLRLGWVQDERVVLPNVDAPAERQLLRRGGVPAQTPPVGPRLRAA